jgi:uncharacterized membrane protein
MKKILIIMFLSIFSIGFAQTSINIMTKDFMYRHKIENDKWSEWSDILKTSYKINIDLENKKIVFINQDNDEKTIYTIKSENFSEQDKVRFIVSDSKEVYYVIQIVSFKNYDEKVLQLLSKNMERVYTVTLF